ncbi:uncharacterized protein A4U43_C07F1680 [Asparagus officinalis]|uniref:M-phase phosphoprotein 6 n=1 Tax=Asparagus officinalis TaxID=4686 RepID=A0A5P1EAJ4_ASPOF|nr:uncharacterized protein LOC109850424 [Asparagus officinalis]ONK62227.1 uncharacterized protein A4U43_C07F1680 [Asparagus officinalis]
MAKREMSTTLRNLKFMQRASQREEPKVKDEEQAEKPKPEESFGASPVPAKRCIVIMEGNPHPGALKGRMSFQSFNPSIDKLHDEASVVHQTQQSNISHQNGSSDREDTNSNAASPSSNSDQKRKQPVMEMETPSSIKLQKTAAGNENEQSSSSQNNSRGKKQKRDKLDWNVLRPPKPSR